MVEVTCPWCDERSAQAWDPEQAEGTCPRCLTSWRYVDSDEAELWLAA